ncbi:MAG TPA: RloB family protein [Anaerohalosphaeraceae bacterium]|nr:RloB family protein [Anaerohalosphaeraceae bacterium]
MSRRPYSRSQLQRRKPSLEPRNRILIVCEGKETEPNYFNHLKNKLRLPAQLIEIEIIPGNVCGSAARSIVNYAIQKIRNSKRNNPFDLVWCLIDVEAPIQTTLKEAYDHVLSYIAPKDVQTKLQLILSNPCFEFWYILHFEKTCRAFALNAEAISSLKRHIPQYDKGNKTIPEQLYNKTATAINNSKLVLKEKNQRDEDLRNCNPSTHVHKIVQYLFDMVKVPIPGCT